MNENMPNKPIEMTDQNISEKINNYQTVVVDCWAPWCGPCKMVSPVIEELAEEKKGKIVFGKLNVDNNKKTAQQYGIMSIPTLLVFKNGELTDKIIGAMPKDKLDEKLQQYE